MASEMGKVRLGISLVYFGLILLVLAWLGETFHDAVFGKRNPQLMPTTLLVAKALSAFGSIVTLFGKLSCLGAPDSIGYGGKESIQGAVLCDLIVIGVSIAFLLGVLPLHIALFAVLGGGILSLVSYFLFLTFLQAVSMFVRRSDLAESARKLKSSMVLAIMLVVAMVASGFIMPPLILLFSLVFLILMLMILVRYARLLSSLKNAVPVS